MGKGGKYLGKKKRGPQRPTTKRKKKEPKDKEIVNKKALFNRYKNKQKVEEEIAKKKNLDHRLQLQQRQVTHSESEEEEEDAFGQLVSCFSNKASRKPAVVSESESEEQSGDDDGSDADMAAAPAAGPPAADSDDMQAESDDDHDDEDDDANEIEEDSESDANLEENEEPVDDPFTQHYAHDLSDELLVSLANTPVACDQVSKSWPVLGNISITIPKPVSTLSKKVKPKMSILEEKVFAAPGTVPHIINHIDFNKLHIKPQIQNSLVSANKLNLIKKDLELTEMLTPLQKELFSVMNNYQDLYYPERSFTNADEIRFTYCLHVANHMLKTRTKILHHNAKLAKKPDTTEEYRDQGLVRPKVLIVVPFKDAAYRVVNTLMDILMLKEAGQVVNKNRFEEDFTGGEIVMPRKNPKPEDYELLFSGNSDDTVRLGMTLTKKTLKLYTDFYSSDIIVASPLGLRMIVGAEGEEDRDYDFLASIELLVLDQADVFLMQNWDHLLHVMDHLHLQPQKTHGTDFSRVRSWAVNGWAKYYRQTLLFSSVDLPEIKAVMNRKCQNYRGRALAAAAAAAAAGGRGAIRQVLLQVPQVFHRFNASSPLDAVEARFQYFVKSVLPAARDALMGHTLLYVPSYFDYVRLRNHFKKEDVSFVQICEYSKDGKIARARDMFFHSEAHFLLYSERAHFYRRLRVKGVRHVVFYQPPTYPHFYSEICNLMQESNQNKYGGSEFNMSVTVLYCKYDLQRLAGVLGAPRAAAAAAAEKQLHMYMTGD
ncbi:U3 small nucleolar RNA-associated protein 25 homolog [Plutella xylostella]|uniref:U3 small nucleolar RNA-associated protein 25 homolog n=1 Tax=Plutella xylostella TaxID=51655 RepID=UPI0020324841|nr:U3 small nucleolar RNA-associated protein 25 homolog [Plutella xylostella]